MGKPSTRAAKNASTPTRSHKFTIRLHHCTRTQYRAPQNQDSNYQSGSIYPAIEPYDPFPPIYRVDLFNRVVGARWQNTSTLATIYVSIICACFAVVTESNRRCHIKSAFMELAKSLTRYHTLFPKPLMTITIRVLSPVGSTCRYFNTASAP